ncbi:MAG: DsrE family protein [Pseudomonadota bacterium]
MKAAIIILSDPKTGSEEALGRVFNALATAYDYQQNGADVTIQFHGAGTRWIAELTKPDHPAQGLFDAVKDNVRGVSCGCADVFGASEEVENAGFDLIKDNPVPDTSGLASLHGLVKEGYTVLTF